MEENFSSSREGMWTLVTKTSYLEITRPDVTEYQDAVEDVFETGDGLVDNDEDRLA
jgi:hypothetical protein